MNARSTSPRHSLLRVLVPCTVRAVGSGLGFGLMALVLLGLSAGVSRAAAGAQRAEVDQGTLFLGNDRGAPARAPTVHTDVHMDVTGMVARVQVRQRFRNPGDDWVEGVYVFPLPDRAAVDRLRMRVGERVIEGRIAERAKARERYETAKRAGQRASLVEQERPNIFTTSVANIGPGQSIEVQITYQQTVRYTDGEFRLRFPMVVGPRYIPGWPTDATAPRQGTGWSPPTDQVPDADRVTPPVRHPDRGPVNPVELAVDLDAGFPVTRVESPHHGIDVERGQPGHLQVRFNQRVYADRDFELIWAPRRGEIPQAAVFTEPVADGAYGLVMVMPPAPKRLRRTPRELIFVVDTSGSMGGASIRQARGALDLALQRLGPDDRFNVIQFNTVTRRLFATAQPVNAQTVARARRYVRGLSAQGGTQMAGALHAALDGREHSGRLRQVVFLTDGAVGNEEGLFRMIRDRLGDSRLFPVGIGSAPNGHFMSRAARFGRGTYTYIGDTRQVRTRMDRLLARLAHPALTDVAVQWPEGWDVEMWPGQVLDLYLGEPLVVAARLPAARGRVRVSGRYGDEPWEATVAIGEGEDGRGIGVLWARRKIEALMNRRARGADPEAIRQAVVELGLAHHLVTRYTSLVAVDVTPVRPDGAPVEETAVPTNLPDGWVYEKVFGRLPRTGTPAPAHLLAGLILLALAGLLYGLGRGLDRSAGRRFP